MNNQLLLPEKTIRKLDGNLKPFPNYTKFTKKLRLSKHWKPCVTEITLLKKKVDKLSKEYEQRQAFGQKVKAARIFKKAMRLTDRLSTLLGFDGKSKVQTNA